MCLNEINTWIAHSPRLHEMQRYLRANACPMLHDVLLHTCLCVMPRCYCYVFVHVFTLPPSDGPLKKTPKPLVTQTCCPSQSSRLNMKFNVIHVLGGRWNCSTTKVVKSKKPSGNTLMAARNPCESFWCGTLGRVLRIGRHRIGNTVLAPWIRVLCSCCLCVFCMMFVVTVLVPWTNLHGMPSHNLRNRTCNKVTCDGTIKKNDRCWRSAALALGSRGDPSTASHLRSI